MCRYDNLTKLSTSLSGLLPSGYSAKRLLPTVDMIITKAKEEVDMIPTKEEVKNQYNELLDMVSKIRNWWTLRDFKSKHRDIPIRILGTYLVGYSDFVFVTNLRYKNILCTLDFGHDYSILCNKVSVFSNSGKIQYKCCKFDEFDKDKTEVLCKNKTYERNSFWGYSDDDLPF